MRVGVSTGRLVDLHNFTVNDVSIEDIANHLSQIQRFNGALPVGTTYSVAEHCINLTNSIKKDLWTFNCPDLLLYALLHDAAETYIGDIVSPVKRELLDFCKLDDVITDVILQKFNIEPTEYMKSTIKEIDKRIVLNEVLAMIPERYDMYQSACLSIEPLRDCDIMFNNHPGTVKQCFLTMFKNLNLLLQLKVRG